MKRSVLTLMVSVVFSHSSLARVWTNTSGASFEGDFLRKEGETAIIIRSSDRKEIPVPINILSEKDQEFISAIKSDPNGKPKTMLERLSEELGDKVNAWYPFESKATIAHDSSRNRTKNNSVQVEWSEQGIIGGCATFNGRASRLPIGSPATFRSSSFTISVWVRTAAQGPQTVFSWGANHKGVAIYTERSTVTCVYRWEKGAKGVEEMRASKVTVNDFKWHHLCLTVSHDQLMTLWFDGVQVAQSKHFEVGKENPTSYATIGDKSDRHVLSDSDLTPFSGSIDEVMIFKGALHEDEVTQLFKVAKSQ
jgi:Ni/Co efflux regulator RcnB